MPEISHDLIALIQYLAPGFIAAAIFYSSTSHAKPSQFERTVQAVIYTVFVQALVVIEEYVALRLGHYVTLGTWTSDSALVAGIATAMAFGVGASAAANHDTLHAWLRHIGVTDRTSHPNEWTHVFTHARCFVMLKLNDGSQIVGWPEIWPDDANKGHFYLTHGTWLGPNDVSRSPMIESILIQAINVAHVEFIREIKREER